MNILLSRHPVVACGGAERAALDLGAALAQLGHKVFLWGPWHSCQDFVDLARRRSIAVIPCHARGRLGEMAELRTACKHLRIDAILSDGRRYNTLMPFAVIGLRIRHYPVLRSLTSTWDEPRKKTILYRMTAPFWTAFWLYMLRRSSHIFCVSNAVATDAQRLLHLGRSQTPVIYDAVSTASRGSRVDKRRIPFKLILVGRIQPVKHFELIIPLMREIQRLGEDVLVEIVGSGECADGLLREIRIAGLEDRVSLLGYREDVMALYQGAHVLVHFCEVEAFARVYFEAQMNGLPVVGVSGGGTSEAVQHGITGFIHEPGHVAEMAQSILSLKRDTALYGRMSANARRWADTFSVATMAKQYESALMDALAGRRDASSSDERSSSRGWGR